MSEPNRAGRVDRRALSSLVLVGGAIAVAAMLGAGAEARSQATPANVSPLFIRVRKQSDELLEGVSNRRLVQVSTASD